jgi:hypothetical protein
MLQIVLALLLVLLPACTRSLTVRAELCDQLSGDSRTIDDYSDLTCARQARLRIYTDQMWTTLVDRCVDLDQNTRLEDLFSTTTGAGRAAPLSLASVDPGKHVAVEINLYAPGADSCPMDSPEVALGRSALVDLQDYSGSSLLVPLAARKACGDTTDGLTLDVRYLEDLSSAPVPALSLGEIYAYDAALSTSGFCRAPTVHRGQLRQFTAGQVYDANRSPTNQVSGTVFFDHSGFAGCTVAHVDDGHGGYDACLGDDPSPHRATMWQLQPDHLDKIRSANAAVPNARNGALVVRVVDSASGDASIAGAKLTFNLKDQRNESEYVLNADWTQIASSPGGTTGDGSGVAVFLDAPTGPYTFSFGDGSSKTFNAGTAGDPNTVTTFVVVK